MLDQLGVGVLVSDIKRLATGFQSGLFKHYERTINVVAHVLALNFESLVCNISVDVIPDCIREVLCNGVE